MRFHGSSLPAPVTELSRDTVAGAAPSSSPAEVWIGTSGWVYKHWMGPFYPQKLPAGRLLAFYADHFRTVEINFSFYRLPDRAVFEHWRQQTPPGFLFAVKGSRYLTHMKKLKEPEEPLARLLERAGGLEEKLGPILFQFPHTWPCNLDRLHGFLQVLRTYAPRRFAFEFRHPSWLTEPVYRLLEDSDAALCLPVSPQVPLKLRRTTSWTYVRFHSGRRGVRVDDDELAEWAERLREFLGQGTDAFVYFNNDPDGHAVRDAQRLQARLELPVLG